jgi:hypothetical protein
VPKVLANHERTRALLNHQHCARMFETVRVLKIGGKSSSFSDCPKQFKYRRAVELGGLAAVEYVLVSIS